jgi:hypothetical protein
LNTPTMQEIMAQQGTRNSSVAPWESYGAEMGDHFSKDLAEAVADYAERRYEEYETSSQNQELLAEQREYSNELSKQYQWITPEEYEDLEPRIGQVISHSELITRLRKAGIKCWYTQHPHADKAVLHVNRKGVYDPDGAEIACWVQIGQMPELSIMNFDEHGVPLAERRRGWRTVLLQMILKGLISETKANQVFGNPKMVGAFRRYNSLLQAFRNSGNNLE